MEHNDRALTKFTSLAHALFHTYELSIPLFIGFWMDAFGVSAAVVGVVVGAGYALIGLGAPGSGVLADYLGSRRLILVSIFGMGLGFALVSLAWNLASFAVAILVWGAFASLYHPAGLSLISRAASQRGTVFAYHGAGGNVGTAFGPLGAALLLTITEWQTAMVLLGLPAIVALVVGLRIEFTTDVERNGDRSLASIRSAFTSTLSDSRAIFTIGFSVAFLAVMLYGTYYRGLLTFLPDILNDSGLARIEVIGRSLGPGEYVYSAMLTVGIAGQYLGGRLTDRIPSTTAFLSSLGVLVVLALLFIPAWNTGTVALVAVCLGLGFTVYATAPIYQVVIAEYSAAEVHGLSYGYTYLAMFGIGAIGASMAGTVLTYATSTTLFVALAGLAATGCACVLLLGRV